MEFWFFFLGVDIYILKKNMFYNVIVDDSVNSWFVCIYFVN